MTFKYTYIKIWYTLNKEKDFVPQLKMKKCGQTWFFETFLDKAKTSETAWLLRFKVVGMTGFEPAASSSRTKRATKLRYIPK